MTATDAGRAPALAEFHGLRIVRGSDGLTIDDDGSSIVGADVFVRAQLAQRFSHIALEIPDEDRSVAWRRFLVHTCAAHLLPGATLDLLAPRCRSGTRAAPDGSGFAEIAAANGLEPASVPPEAGRPVGVDVDTNRVIVARWHRTTGRTIHDLVAEARSSLDRLGPEELRARLGRTDTVVLDTRTPTDREADGVIVGSRHAPRTVLEWVIDPASGYADDLDRDQCLVVVCNEGYSSSLAARTLQELGFPRSTDLIGGMQAWRAAGHPTHAPDGHHGRCLLPEDPRPG